MDEADWSLERIRAEIDAVDAQILKLLERRATLALRAKREKLRLGLPVEDPEREQEVIQKAVRQTRGPLPPAEVQRIFASIVASCRNLQVASGYSGMEAR